MINEHFVGVSHYLTQFLWPAFLFIHVNTSQLVVSSFIRCLFFLLLLLLVSFHRKFIDIVRISKSSILKTFKRLEMKLELELCIHIVASIETNCLLLQRFSSWVNFQRQKLWNNFVLWAIWLFSFLSQVK